MILPAWSMVFSSEEKKSLSHVFYFLVLGVLSYSLTDASSAIMSLRLTSLSRFSIVCGMVISPEALFKVLWNSLFLLDDC